MEINYDDASNSASSSLPSQKLPISKKTKNWRESCVNYYEKLTFTTFKGKRSTNVRKLINYDLFNGKFNLKDLENVANPLGIKTDQFPATLQHYDIVSPALMLLIGEETKRPDVTVVVSEGPESVNRKTDGLKKKIMQSLQQSLMGQIDPSTIDPNNPPPTPEEIIKYEKYTPSDIIESKANKILKILKKRLILKEVFKAGWKDVLIAGEEIYWSGIINGEPIVRRCNPAQITVLLDADSEFIDEAVAVSEARMLSVPTIIQEFGDILNPDQIDELEKLAKNHNTQYNNIQNQFQYTEAGAVDSALSTSAQTNTPYGNVRVVRIEWISMRKQGFLSYTDENGQPQELDVDESFKLVEFKEVYPDATVEWEWMNEAWEGTKIARDIFVNIQPKPNQRKRLDNPYSAKLGYTGLIYNSTNSQSVSLLDRLKPYQYLYNVLMYRLELAFASDHGKVMLMDLAQLPKSEGFDVEKWMYYLRAMKIGFINSFEESNKGSRQGQFAQFNQFQSIDLSMANTIQQYIQSLEFIKVQIAFLSGISPQRLGAVQSNELVGNVEKSINQSALITEYWFDMHEEVKRRTYQAIVEVAKIAYRKGKAFQYVLDDMGIETLNIEELELDDTEFAVFMSRSAKDLQAIQEVKQLFQAALQADKANLSDLVNILQTDSLTDIKHALKDAEEKRMQQQGEQAKAQNEAQQKELEFTHSIETQKLDIEKEKLDREDTNKELDRQNKIELESIKALGLVEGMSKQPDMNQNMIPDVLEQGKLALEHTKEFFDQSHRTKELEQTNKELEHKKQVEKSKQELDKKKVELENKKINSQKEIEKLKVKQTELKTKTEKEKSIRDAKLKEKEIKAKVQIAKSKPKIKK